jgi:hypothetical protein
MSNAETTIRARIKTVIETVSNVGQVHDYQRYAVTWEEMEKHVVKTISGADVIRYWAISLDGLTLLSDTFQGGGFTDTMAVEYQYVVRGFMGVDDANSSEKTFVTLIMSILEALSADATLSARLLETNSPVVAESRIEHRVLTGILCHYCEIKVVVQETLT